MRGREKDSKREGVCVYMELIHSVISRDEYNTVNQLYCNKGNFKNLKKGKNDKLPKALKFPTCNFSNSVLP